MISITVVLTQPQAAPQAAPEVPPVPSAAEINRQVREGLARAGVQGNDRVTIDQNGIIVRPAAPGQPTVVLRPRDVQNMVPPQAVDISIAFFIMIAVMVVGWPIARAFGRRIERRGQVATLDTGTIEQLRRIEQAVDAMAIEVERISESQRFMARLQRDATAQPLPGIESR